MIGVIAGDIIGSVYEFTKHKSYDFQPLFHVKSKFTDDTVCTLAVMKSINESSCPKTTMHQFCREYFSTGGWGKRFIQWMCSKDPQPYNSYGNGSAMRIAPVAFVATSLDEALKLSDAYTGITHNHPEGMSAARAVVESIYLAREGLPVNDIRQAISKYYELDFTIASIRQEYQRTERALYSVPQAIAAALEANSFEDAIRLAVSLGGDTDTQAAIAGGIAEARFGVPHDIKDATLNYLDSNMLNIVEDFYQHHRNDS
jgi:ADP-ribosylglycohydrolase